MRPTLFALVAAISVAATLLPKLAAGQFEPKETATKGCKLGEAKVSRWRCGVSVSATAGPSAGILGTLPIPIEWPEQEVRIDNEEISPQVKNVRYRTLAEGGVKQMEVSIPRLNAGETATVYLTFQVTRSVQLPPDDTSIFVVPKKTPKDVLKYLGPSPYIETRSEQIRELANQIGQDKQGAWEQVEAIYDWVREHIKYRKGPLKGAQAALRDKEGDCEEMTALFVALCRVNKIPARSVWVPDHCYPEFYLADDDGNGHWFPCQAAGTRAFGAMPDPRPILQKGDKFVVPGKKEPQRYVAEFMQAQNKPGLAKPEVRFERKLLDR